jgi:hypothetical protein
MGDIASLQEQPVNLAENHEFVADCCRYRENILDEKAVKKKWKFDAATWERLGDDDALVEKIEAESVRRIRTGASKREKAQKLVVAAPDVAASIMNSTEANDRHRLDACKVLNDLSANPADNGPAADASRFIISINLNGDTEHYDKPRAVCIDDGESNVGNAAPQKAIPWDDGDDAAARAQKSSKAIKREQTPLEIAIESMMRY